MKKENAVRKICPKCGVTSENRAEFCVSCGQPMKSSVSSIPPSRISRPPASELNARNVVVETPPIAIPRGKKTEQSVRYRTIATNPKSQAPVMKTAEKQGPADNFRETVVLHTPVSRTSEAPASMPSQKGVNPPISASPSVAPRNSTPPKFVDGDAKKMMAIKPIGVSSSSDLQSIRTGEKRDFVLTSDGIPPLELQHVWYTMTKFENWDTIAVMSASDSGSVLNIAHGLGQMAVREPCDFVRVVNASLKVAELHSDEEVGAEHYPYEYFDLIQQLHPIANSQAVTQIAKELLSKFDSARASGTLRHGKVFMAVDSVLSHADSIALCRAVDKIILCIDLGQTKFESVRKIIEIVGKEKILGCVTTNSKM